ncbi:MAG TPA: response regulator [Candidatus Synoicihabitans sp.]|nr:response regulator [Candidatus Synoicihabitans sp.]
MSNSPFSNVALIAEDEPIIRSLLKSLLERRGLRVLAASDGVEALELFHAHGEEIGLIITDLNMPRLDGPELLRRLTSGTRHPGIIVTSGLPEMIEDVRRQWRDEVVVMPKPYDSKDLALALERVRALVPTG